MEITSGIGGTLITATYEEQLFELANFCAIAQRDPVKNPNERDYIQVQIEDYGISVRIEFDFPLIAEDLGPASGYGFTGGEYLTGSGFTPGTDGTIQVATTLGYFYKLIYGAQIAEAPLSETNINRISGNHNSDNTRFSGSCNFESFQQVGDQGQVCTFVKPYIPNS